MQAFTSQHIPDYVLTSVKAKLEGMTNKGAIADLFNGTIERMQHKPQATPEQVLLGIQEGVKALELRR